jgi:hypothetical protein
MKRLVAAVPPAIARDLTIANDWARAAPMGGM